ncbi:histidine kinase [Lentzea sp. NPDC006480]|uniref:sensor histidine kinase n=1 Tax=Lentzea sp. NPDC006480 TaxID=3157176 RepID=UPI0033B23AE4
MGFACVGNVLGRFAGRGRKQEKQHVCVEDAALVERDRMARELHDIVSHGLALILVRAGVARSLDDPGQTNEAIEVIERTARDSLAEMRHMLDVLRLPHDAGWAPQPDLGGVDELVAVARAAGACVDLVRIGTPHGLHACHELTVYRIVQDGLSDVVGAAIVTVEFRADRLVVDVATGAAVEGSRLARIRERVAVSGGSLFVRCDDDTFRLTATLPLRR